MNSAGNVSNKAIEEKGNTENNSRTVTAPDQNTLNKAVWWGTLCSLAESVGAQSTNSTFWTPEVIECVAITSVIALVIVGCAVGCAVSMRYGGSTESGQVTDELDDDEVKLEETNTGIDEQVKLDETEGTPDDQQPQVTTPLVTNTTSAGYSTPQPKKRRSPFVEIPLNTPNGKAIQQKYDKQKEQDRVQAETVLRQNERAFNEAQIGNIVESSQNQNDKNDGSCVIF